jgi:hypothetical protein
VGQQLGGQPYAWFNSLFLKQNEVTNPLHDWNLFKETLIKQFGVSNTDSTVQELYSLTNSNYKVEQLNDYSTKFRILANQLNWNEEALIQTFKQGLPRKIRELLVGHNLATLNELITTSVLFGNQLIETGFKSYPTKFVNHQNPQHQVRGDSIGTPMDINSIQKRRSLTVEERQERIDKNQCIICGSGEHYRNKCPHSRFNKQHQSYSPMVTIVSNPGVEIRRAVVDITLPDFEGRKFSALLDSGADISFIHSKTLNLLDLPTLRLPQPFQPRLADGGKAKRIIDCKTDLLSYQMGTLQGKKEFHVMDMNYDFVFGMDWFHHSNPLINWRDMTIDFDYFNSNQPKTGTDKTTDRCI